MDKGWAGITGEESKGVEEVMKGWEDALKGAGVERSWVPVFAAEDYSPERLAVRYMVCEEDPPPHNSYPVMHELTTSVRNTWTKQSRVSSQHTTTYSPTAAQLSAPFYSILHPSRQLAHNPPATNP